MSSSAMPVVLLGAGGHARVLLEILESSAVEVAGYIAPTAANSRVRGIPWLGPDSELVRYADAAQAVNGVGSVGDATRRVAAYETAVAAGMTFRTVVHTSALVSESAQLDDGAQLLAGSIVGAGTRIGTDAVINSGAVIDHDCVVGAHSHVAPGAVVAGEVDVGALAHIGLGARVLQGVSIGTAAVVGAGAVVINDVADYTTVVGVPAVLMKAKRRD